MKEGLFIHQVIYVDVLILINLVVNYLLLLSTAAVAGLKIKSYRLIISSSLGAIYSLIIFIPDLNLCISILLKIACSVLMIFIAFIFNSIKQFIRAYASFLLSNFMFAGLMLAIWITFKPNGMIYQNGAVYFDVNAVYLIICAVISYITSFVISKFIKHRAPDSHIIDLTINNKCGSVLIKTLLDTGNALKEPFSSFPVIICEYNSIKELIPQNIKDSMNKMTETDLSSINNIRFVSFKSVGGSGLLPAFKPQSVNFKIKGKEYKNTDVYIAVYNKSLSNGEYNALMGTLILEYSSKGENNNKKSYKKNYKFNT